MPLLTELCALKTTMVLPVSPLGGPARSGWRQVAKVPPRPLPHGRGSDRHTGKPL